MVFGLPLLRPLLYKLLDASGHDELLVLLGLLLALVVGGLGFEAVGLSSELGALIFGAMLANHPRSQELSRSLWSVKEMFLVGFFLQIGIGGLPQQLPDLPVTDQLQRVRPDCRQCRAARMADSVGHHRVSVLCAFGTNQPLLPQHL